MAAVLCASASADGYAKVWDSTKNLTDIQSDDPLSDKKKKIAGSAHPSAFSAVCLVITEIVMMWFGRPLLRILLP